MPTPSRPKLVYVVTHTKSARCFLDGQLAFMRQCGFDLYLISSPGDGLDQIAEREGITTIAVPMEREMSPLRDLQSLWRLFWVLRRLRPQVVNAGTPKAGLLAMIAAWCLRVPVRLYSQWGLRLETTTGFKRAVLTWAERINASCAHQVLCNSESLKQTCIELGLSSHRKTCVLGPGSTNGVDSQRFCPADATDQDRAARLREMGLNPQAPVIGFVGRLTRDKGIVDLCRAFERLASEFADLQLLLVGDFETGDAVPEETIRQLQAHPRVVITGYVDDTSSYYSLFDLLVFPSFREGFPNVILEASASALPIVAYAATGTVDAVQDGATGLLAPVGDIESLTAAIRFYLTNPQVRQTHGAAGRRRVVEQFQPEMIWELLLKCYRNGTNLQDRADDAKTLREQDCEPEHKAA